MVYNKKKEMDRSASKLTVALFRSSKARHKHFDDKKKILSYHKYSCRVKKLH